MTSQQQEDSARPRPVNPEAFDAYLQGYHFFQGRSDKDVNTAAKYFERATQPLGMAGVVKLFAEEFHGGFVQARRDNGEAVFFYPPLKRIDGVSVAQNQVRISQDEHYAWSVAKPDKSGTMTSLYR